MFKQHPSSYLSSVVFFRSATTMGQGQSENSVWAEYDPVTSFVVYVENSRGRIGPGEIDDAIMQLCSEVRAHVRRLAAGGHGKSRFVRVQLNRMDYRAARKWGELLQGSNPVVFNATFTSSAGERVATVHELVAFDTFDATLRALIGGMAWGELLTLGIDLSWAQFETMCTRLPGRNPEAVMPEDRAEDRVYDPAISPAHTALGAAFTVWLQSAPAMARSVLAVFTDSKFTLPSGATGQEPSKLANAWLASRPPAEATSQEQIDFVSRLAVDMVSLVTNAVTVAPGLLHLCGGHLVLYSGIAEDSLSVADADTQRPLFTGTMYAGAEVGWFRRRMVSSSLLLSVATRFANGVTQFQIMKKQRLAKCCVFRLHVVPPMRILPVWSMSVYPYEMEVVLPPGYRWRVTSAGALPSDQSMAVRDLECVNPDLYEDPAVRDHILEGLETRVGRPFLSREDFDTLFGEWQPLYDAALDLD